MYYVYHHIRLDNNSIFYVGKGKKHRLNESSNRNRYWHNIVNKVGYKAEIVCDNLSEEQALQLEKDLISKYKLLNYNLCNMTDGGDGISGYKHTNQTKKILVELNKNRQPDTAETRIKKGLAWKGKKRKPFTEEHKEKLRQARKKQIMNKVTEETKRKISLSNKGKKRTEEQRKYISLRTKQALQDKV